MEQDKIEMKHKRSWGTKQRVTMLISHDKYNSSVWIVAAYNVSDLPGHKNNAHRVG